MLIHQEPASLKSTLPASFASPIGRDFGIVFVLLLINLFCFQRTLKGYFLADDFVHLPYLIEVFKGHPDMLLRNFHTNWMQAQGTEFYRPFISISLAIDYAFWKTNAVGYHLTNFLYQFAASVLLFLCSRKIFSYKSTWEAHWVSFTAAALFAAYPLHVEVVSWIIARVDSVATAFLLSSIWFYLRNRDCARSTDKALSMLSFILALLSKEMAITLPPTLVLLELLKPGQPLRSRLKLAAKNTWPYWTLLLIYLGIRTASLGTVSGGYAGSIGQGLSHSLFKRWFEDGSLWRILFPLNAELPASSHRLVRNLRLLYGLAAGLSVVRAILLLACSRLKEWLGWLTFALGWFVIALLPTYQVWNLTETLQGSRFIYLGTAPLCLLLALFIAPLQYSAAPKTWQTFINGAAVSLSLAFLICFMHITYLNNGAWAQASRGVRAFRQAIEQWFTQNQNTKTLVVLNIPQKYQGAHMLYNAATMSVLLRPPLCKKNYTDRVVTFEPITFGDADLINRSRLERMLTDNQHHEFVKWEPVSQRLIPLHLTNSRVTRTIKGTDLTDNLDQLDRTALVSPALDLPSTASDFVDVTVVPEPLDKKPGSIAMSWNTQSDPIFRKNNTLTTTLDGTRRARFCVSEHKNWILSDTIHQLKFELPNHVQISQIDLLPGDNQIPILMPDSSKINASRRSMVEDVAGICRPGSQLAYFNYDASKIIGADHVVIEISKADSWFEHYSGTLRDKDLSKESSITETKPYLKKEGNAIAAEKLSRAGFYEMRICAVDKSGRLVGYPSDPLNLQFSLADVRK